MPDPSTIVETVAQTCPVCGCQLGESPYKEGEVAYCCEPCAHGSPDECDCGCCEVVSKDKS